LEAEKLFPSRVSQVIMGYVYSVLSWDMSRPTYNVTLFYAVVIHIRSSWSILRSTESVYSTVRERFQKLYSMATGLNGCWVLPDQPN